MSSSDSVSPAHPSLARSVQLTLLDVCQTEDQLEAGCATARAADIAAVCIKPYAVQMAARWLAGSPVRVGTVVGGEGGMSDTPVKVAEAEIALASGATELEFAVNIARVLEENWSSIVNELTAVAEQARSQNAALKLRVETDLIPAARFEPLCEIARGLALPFLVIHSREPYVAPAAPHNEAAPEIAESSLSQTQFPPFALRAREEELLQVARQYGLNVQFQAPVTTLDQIRALQQRGIARIATANIALLSKLQ